MSAAFKRAVSILSDSDIASLRDDQRAFLRSRNECGSDRRCILTRSQERLGEIERYNAPSPASLPPVEVITHPPGIDPGVTVQPSSLIKIAPNNGRTWLRHSERLGIAAISDGERIQLWEIASGRLLRFLEHEAYVENFFWIEDDRRIVGAYKDGFIRTWDPLSGTIQTEARLLSDDWFKSAWHEPKSDLLVLTTTRNEIIGWDYEKVERAFIVEASVFGDETLYYAALSRDGATLLAMSFVGGGTTIRLIDIGTKRALQKVSIDSPASVIQLIDESTILVQSTDKACEADLHRWDISFSPPRKTLLSTAPGCHETALEQLRSYGDIVATEASSDGVFFVSRAGVPGSTAIPISGSPRLLALEDPQLKYLVGVSGSLGLAFESDRSLALVDLEDGSIRARLKSYGFSRWVEADADGTFVFRERELRVGGEQIFVALDIATGIPVRHRVALPKNAAIEQVAIGADRLLAASTEGQSWIYEISSGKLVAEFSNLSGILSPDGKLVLGTVDEDGRSVVELLDPYTGKRLLRVRPKLDPDSDDSLTAMVFSPDSRLIGLGWLSGRAEVWSVATRKLVRGLEAAPEQMTTLAFSADGSKLAGGGRDSGLYLWDTATGKLTQTFERDSLSHHVSTGGLSISRDAELIAAGPDLRYTSSGDLGRERRVQVWDAKTGHKRFDLFGHSAGVGAVVFTPDRRWIVSGSYDGTVRYWDRKTGRLAATMIIDENGHWNLVTSAGFFAASQDADRLLSAVSGFTATGIDQIWRSLYAPDLVRAYLAGDPDGEVAASAKMLSLSSVLGSTPPPGVAIQASAPISASDTVVIAAQISDRGKGVGRIEWRVNGITAGVLGQPSGQGPVYTVSREVALETGENTIEVIAYNAGNLLASRPDRVTITYPGSADSRKPRLHILAIGINAYIDRGWIPAHGTQSIYFGKLGLAVADAIAFASDMEHAAQGLYEDVNVTLALDADASQQKLDRLIDKVGSEIHPRDTFVLFAAAHGTSENGIFYLIPQDFQSGPDALSKLAIGQDRLQDWLANRIKAKRALVLLDTCESGALIAGHMRSRFGSAASQAGIGRLHEATGRPVLTAAASGQFAHEGLIAESGARHGVFTWALLEALRKGDSNSNGVIELSELAAHVQAAVPKLAANLGGLGRSEAALKQPVFGQQAARFGSRGEDFSIARKLD